MQHLPGDPAIPTVCPANSLTLVTICCQLHWHLSAPSRCSSMSSVPHSSAAPDAHSWLLSTFTTHAHPIQQHSMAKVPLPRSASKLLKQYYGSSCFTTRSFRDRNGVWHPVPCDIAARALPSRPSNKKVRAIRTAASFFLVVQMVHWHIQAVLAQPLCCGPQRNRHTYRTLVSLIFECVLSHIHMYMSTYTHVYTYI